MSSSQNEQMASLENYENVSCNTSTTTKSAAILALPPHRTSDSEAAAGKKMFLTIAGPQGEEHHDRDDLDPPTIQVEQRAPTTSQMLNITEKNRDRGSSVDLLNLDDVVLLAAKAAAPTTPMTTIPPSSPTEQGQGRGQLPGQVRPFSSRRTTAGGSGGSFDSCTSGSSSLASATAGAVFVDNKNGTAASDPKFIFSSAGENKNASTRSSYDLLEDQVVDNISPVNLMTSEQPLSSSVSPPPGLEVVVNKQGEEGNDVELRVLSNNYISPEQLDYNTTKSSSCHQGLQLVRAKEVQESSIVTLDLDDMLFKKKATAGDQDEDVKSKKNATDVLE